MSERLVRTAQNHMKTTAQIMYAAFTLFALVCFALSPQAQAVTPAPDGGYPGFNTAEGQSALRSLTTGVGNTAVGWFSLWSNTDGSFNTGVGAGALLFNVGDQSTGVGTQNTAIGAGALLNNSTGTQNTANGAFALVGNTTGDSNTANGYQSLYSNTTGILNTADGQLALYFNTTGNENTALGQGAGKNIINGSNNIDIGYPSPCDPPCPTSGPDESNTIRIGDPAMQTATFIAGISGATVTGTAVVINGSGQLGVAPSSARFKEAIKPMDKASEAVLALKPVTFRYKKELDPEGVPEFGLVAEDVVKVSPDLVARDAKGKVFTVRYDAVNAMLLNEFLKEHHIVQEQQATITQLESTVAQQKKDFQATVTQLTARLDEQASQIQKVSARIEASKPAPQVVNNP